MPDETPKFSKKAIGNPDSTLLPPANDSPSASAPTTDLESKLPAAVKPARRRKPTTPRTATARPKRRLVDGVEPAVSAPAANQRVDETLAAIYGTDQNLTPRLGTLDQRPRHSAGRALKIIIILLLLTATALAVLFRRGAVTGSELTFVIEGDAEWQLGATSTIAISYQNPTAKAVAEVFVRLRYPENFHFITSSLAATNADHTEWRLPDVPAGGSGRFTISGQQFGQVGLPYSWRLFGSFRPANFNSTLQAMAAFSTTLAALPWDLAISGPAKQTLDTETEYRLTISTASIASLPPPNIFLELRPPNNFIVASSSPAFNKQKRWPLNAPTNLADTREFTVRGRFTSTTLDTGVMSAALLFKSSNEATGILLAERHVTTTLIRNEVTARLAINGSLTKISTTVGETLNLTIELKNGSGDPIKNATLNLILDAPAVKRQSLLDWAALNDEHDGDVRGEQIDDRTRRGRVTWNKQQLPALALLKPNDAVSFNLQLPLKTADKFPAEDLTQNKISANVSVEFLDAKGQVRSLTSDPLAIIINSDLKFDHQDQISQSDGSETHSLSWILTNHLHPLKDLTLAATVFGDVSFSTSAPAPAGTVAFDATAKTILWSIPAFPSAVDVLAMPFTITLHNKNPTQSLLISKVLGQAVDTVTGETIEFFGTEIPL